MLSLKTFHVFFIIVSIALAFGFGVWALRDYWQTHNTTNMALGIGSLIVGGVLIGYISKIISKI